MNEREAAAVKAIETLKQSQWGLTAVKTELEAHLNRRYGGQSCQYNCDEDGQRTCDECNGNYDSVECYECSGSGVWTCSECDERGTVVVNEETVECSACDGEGRLDCEECDGDGERYCDHCDEGYINCECDRDETEHDWASDTYCHNYLMEKLSELGLAERGDWICLHNGVETRWNPVYPLVYAEFYNDGSVDSEFTFTLGMDDPRAILLKPKIIEIFNDMAREITSGAINTQRAGMHMALINAHGGEYPTDATREHIVRYENFRKSMTLLMPALFLLGTGNEISREMRYRVPMVGCTSGMTHNNGNGKYSAVCYRNGALEFRVFETCYDNPEQILDNIVVMKNCMKFWSDEYVSPRLERITTSFDFGNNADNTVKRLYVTNEHIDLLNKGLKILKPSYLTIKEIKAKRKFDTTKRHINNRLKVAEKEAKVEYKEYVQRYDWSKVMNRHLYMSRLLDNRVRHNQLDIDMAAIEEEAVQLVEFEVQPKKTLEQYVKDKVEQIRNASAGEYRLQV